MATVYPFCNATGCGICSGDQYVLMSSGNTFSEEQISILCSSLLDSTYNASLAASTNYISANVAPSIQGVTEGLNCIYLVGLWVFAMMR